MSSDNHISLHDPDYYDDDNDDADDTLPCSICTRLIGDEVAYGDTWDGRAVCEECAQGPFRGEA